MAIALKKEPVKLSIIMEGDVETPTRLVGKKVVPILRKNDGSHMTESLDIVRYIDAINGPVFSGQVKTEIDEWIKDAWPVALRLFIPRFTQGDFPELSTPESREAYRQREEEAFGDLNVLMGNTPQLVKEISPKLRALEPLLLQRDKTDINDIVLWPLLRCLSIVKALSFPPAVRDYANQLESQTGIPMLFNQAT